MLLHKKRACFWCGEKVDERDLLFGNSMRDIHVQVFSICALLGHIYGGCEIEPEFLSKTLQKLNPPKQWFNYVKAFLEKFIRKHAYENQHCLSLLLRRNSLVSKLLKIQSGEDYSKNLKTRKGISEAFDVDIGKKHFRSAV